MMLKRYPRSSRTAARKARVRSRRPEAEALEGRILLYATYSPTAWTYSSRITYSFMQDGTSIAGTPSVLFQTMNAVASTGTWEQQIEQAATPWETNANLNLALVPETPMSGTTGPGYPVGTNGDQQDDPRFGDIRIGAMPLPAGVLAETFLPPPTNGGTVAGDIVFNSTIKWQIGGGYDLQTVAAHEFGHALGLADQSTDIYSEMYYAYDGIKTALDSDDIAGIQSIYGAPQYDRFNNSGTHNNLPFTATPISSYIDPNGQIALSSLDNTLATQTEYYSVTVPSSLSNATPTGQMVVTLQSSNLSSLAPGLYVVNTSMQIIAQSVAATTYGAQVAVTVPVTAGQTYYIKVASVAGLYGRVGAYGLEVNFGPYYQAPIAPPNTVVAQQPNGGSNGTTNAMIAGGGRGGAISGSPDVTWAAVGSYTGWVDAYAASAGGPASPTAATPTPTVPTPTPTVPTAPSTGIDGPAAPLPGSSGAPTQASPTVVALITPLPAPSPTAAPASRKLVHQAVDASLPGWRGHRRRSQAGAKTRSVLRGSDSLA
jgi:Matrixin